MAVKTQPGGTATADERDDDGAPAPDAVENDADVQAHADVTPDRYLEEDAEDLLNAELGEEDEEEDGESAGDESQDEADDEADDGDDEEDNEAERDEDVEAEDADAAEEPEDDEDDDDSEDDSAEDVPKGMEGWPKPAVSRIQKQSEKIRQLTAQASEQVTLNPSPANPLAHTKTAEEVAELVRQAKQVRDWVNANPDGGTVELAGGATLEISPEDAMARRANAEALIEAAPKRNEFHAKRERSKPWELAEQVVPGLFDDSTSAGKFRRSILAEVPEMMNAPDHEIVIAAAALGYKQIVEEQKGVAKYVRIELDPKTGKPKRKPSPAKSAQTKPGKKPSKVPSSARPPQRTKQAAGTERLSSLAASAAESGSDEELAELLAAELD